MADEVQKPLTRDERRDLKSLIKGDYENLRLKLSQEVNDAANAEAEEIRKKYADRDVELLECGRAIREMRERFRREYEDQIAEFRDQNFVIKTDSFSNSRIIKIELPDSFRVKGLEEELETSRQKWTTIRSKGMNSLSTQENDSQRQLIMTGLTNPGATELLDSLPSAEEVVKTAIASFGVTDQIKQIDIGQ